MMTYTIKKIADLAGVSTRTLRYYDEIGLLEPSTKMDNGYRLYDHQNLLDLQQILFYRERDIPLEEIQLILNQPDFSPLKALEKQRDVLENRKKRIEILIRTVESTIENIEGEKSMPEKEFFDGFREEEYADEAKKLWGNTKQYKESQRKWSIWRIEYNYYKNHECYNDTCIRSIAVFYFPKK